MLQGDLEGKFVLNENSVNQGEVAAAPKVKLVTAESVCRNPEDVAHLASVGQSVEAINNSKSQIESRPSSATEGRTASDLRKVMYDLTSDDFLRVLEESSPEQIQALVSTFEKTPRTTGGSGLWQKIAAVPQERWSLFSVLYWWECRRPFYNAAVCLSGLPSVLILSLFGLWFPAILAALFYAICANVCYCLGAPAEVIARLCFKEKAAHSAPVLLGLGTIFSVMLTVALELLVLITLAFSGMGHRF